VLVNVDEQGICRIAGVVRPQIRLLQPYAIQRLTGQAIASVGQRLRIGKDPAQRVNRAGMSLDIGRRAEVVRRRSDADTDGRPIRIANSFGRCRHQSPCARNSAVLASISSPVRMPFSISSNSRAAVHFS